jgi:hypothetical protein
MNKIKEKNTQFNNNLINFSHSNDLSNAKNEWFLIECFSEIEKTTQCICSRKIKHLNYMYNFYNQKVIICGSECLKKCGILKITVQNKILQKVLKGALNQYKEKYDKSPEINAEIYLKMVKDTLFTTIEIKRNSIMAETDYIVYRIEKLQNLFCNINELENSGYKNLNETKCQITKHIKDLFDEIKQERIMKRVKRIFLKWHKLANNKMFEYVELIKSNVTFGQYENKTYGELCLDLDYCIWINNERKETKIQSQKNNIKKIQTIVNSSKYEILKTLMIKTNNIIEYKSYNYIQ